jgi:hypothetical protein
VTAGGTPAQACPPAQRVSAEPPRKRPKPPAVPAGERTLSAQFRPPRMRREAAHVFLKRAMRLGWCNRHESQIELTTARDQLKALHERAEEYRRKHSEALSHVLGTVKLLTTTSLIVTALAT